MNFAKFVRIPFFKEHLRWLLLNPEKSFQSFGFAVYLLAVNFKNNRPKVLFKNMFWRFSQSTQENTCIEVFSGGAGCHMSLKGFSCGIAHYKGGRGGGGWISVVQGFFTSINGHLILAGGVGYHSRGFRYFPHYFWFPRILSLMKFGSSWGNSYIPCLQVIIANCFTCGERKIW